MKSTKQKSILFVCMGNICRSPLAEGVFRNVALQTSPDQVSVDSAGTHGYHVGDAPDARAVAAARRRQIDISQLRARTVTGRDFSRFDLVVAMDRDNHALLAQRFPAGIDRLRLFMDFAGEADTDVPDPYYGGPEGFELVLDLVERGADALLAELLRQR